MTFILMERTGSTSLFSLESTTTSWVLLAVEPSGMSRQVAVYTDGQLARRTMHLLNRHGLVDVELAELAEGTDD